MKSILEDGGQILVFLNKRRSTQSTALLLRDLVKNFLTDDEKTTCRDICAQIESIKGHNRDLITVIQKGLAFHHAGLLPKERKYVEDAFRKKILKVICATTTLSAGINMPSRTVILRDFKRYVISGHRIKNFSGFYENGDGFSYFMPFSANEVFQM